MNKKLSSIIIETDYLSSLKLLREIYLYLTELKAALSAKKKNIEEAVNEIFLIQNLLKKLPLWNNDQKLYKSKFKAEDIEEVIFVVGKKLNRKMEGKVSSVYLFNTIDNRWTNPNNIIHDIDEIKTNVLNYSNKVFASYFVLITKY